MLCAALALPVARAQQPEAVPAGDAPTGTTPYDVVQKAVQEAFAAADAEVDAARDAVREAEDVRPAISQARDVIDKAVERTAKSLGVPMPKIPTVARRVMDPGIVENTDGSRLVDEFLANTGWQQEDWGDDARLSFDGERMVVEYETGMKRKVAVTKFLRGKLSLDANDVVVIDVDPRDSTFVSLSVAFFVGHLYYEAPSQRLKKGMNAIRFPLSARNFKSQETGWQYRGGVPSPMQPDKLSLLIYASRSGQLAVDRVRVVKAR